MKHQCENCDDEFEATNSDSNEPTRFCSHDCEQEREDRVKALNDDWEGNICHDHSMDF